MSSNIKNRILCHICHRGFDMTKEGFKTPEGYWVCPECYQKHYRYTTINDHIKKN